MNWIIVLFGASLLIFLGLVALEKFTAPANKRCVQCRAKSSYLTRGKICQECVEAYPDGT